jgi:hypothetical protein
MQQQRLGGLRRADLTLADKPLPGPDTDTDTSNLLLEISAAP